VDLLVVTPRGLFLVEIKSFPGVLFGDGQRWRLRFPSGSEKYYEHPLILTNTKAKRLRSLMSRQRAFRSEQAPWVTPLVVLSSAELDIRLHDIARTSVCGRDPDLQPVGTVSHEPTTAFGALPGIVEALKDPSAVGQRGTAIDRPLSRRIAEALEAAGLQALSTRTGEPPDTLRMALSLVQRLVNLDGAEILAVRSDGTIELNRELAVAQFELAGRSHRSDAGRSSTRCGAVLSRSVAWTPSLSARTATRRPSTTNWPSSRPAAPGSRLSGASTAAANRSPSAGSRNGLASKASQPPRCRSARERRRCIISRRSTGGSASGSPPLTPPAGRCAPWSTRGSSPCTTT